MLLGWAQCARCERTRASAIRSAEFFEKYTDASRQLAPGPRKFAPSQERSSPKESSLFAIARKSLQLKIMPVSLWGSRFCADFLCLPNVFNILRAQRGRGGISRCSWLNVRAPAHAWARWWCRKARRRSLSTVPPTKRIATAALQIANTPSTRNAA
jgi:hypothetical protein